MKETRNVQHQCARNYWKYILQYFCFKPIVIVLYFIGLQTASTVVLDAHGVDHFMRQQNMKKSVLIPTALEQR